MSSRSGSILLPHSLRAKLTLPLLVLLAVVAGAIGFSVYEQRGMSAANEALARQTMPALTQSADVLGSLYRAHLHERAALNVNVRTDDFKQVRTAHDTELQEAAKGIESLRRLAGGADEGSATLVQSLHEAYLAWSTTSLEVFDNLAKDSRFARLLAIDLSGGKSREQFDALEEKITRLKDDWVARSEANVEAMGERSALAQKLLTVIGVLAAVFAAAVAILLPSTLSRRLNDIRSRIVAISEGDGDLTQRLKIGGDDEIARIAQAFDRFVENLHETIRRATIASQAVAASTQEIASGNQNLASRAEEQAAHLVNASHSLSQMAESIAANAASAEQVSQTTRGTRDTADRGNEVIRRAIRAMQEINEASQRIGDIIGVVDSIAFQTNILALNAAVEAARAGEQGRGFSVVASEVRSLAQRSASSANEIKTLINAATEKVQLGSELVNASGETLEEIMAAIREVTATVTEIAESTTAQSHEVQGINHMIQEIGDGMQATTAFVEEVAASSAQLNERADELLQEVGRFRLEA